MPLKLPTQLLSTPMCPLTRSAWTGSTRAAWLSPTRPTLRQQWVRLELPASPLTATILE